MKKLLMALQPVFGLFVLINALIVIYKNFLAQRGFEINFLVGANAILFLLSSFGIFIQTKGVNSSSINAFIRGVYSSLLLKMFVIVAAVFIYIFVTGGKVNQPSLFTSMGFYLLYTSIEVIQLMKIARKKPND
ncbi:MAG: hypothetical protein M3Z26_08000 [Bacteroidota bacterium]|nr:hypothetical protein [Bacteroidota bacterium]